MMDIKTMSRKLRAAADALDALLRVEETQEKAADILESVKARRVHISPEKIRAFKKATARTEAAKKAAKARWAKPGAKKPSPPTMRGYQYKPGTHWTQKPENKAKLARVAKLMTDARKKGA